MTHNHNHCSTFTSIFRHFYNVWHQNNMLVTCYMAFSLQFGALLSHFWHFHCNRALSPPFQAL